MAIPVKTKRSHWPISILSTIASFINILLPLALVRILTPDEVGTFKVFFLYLMILPAFSFTSGVINGLSYWVGREDRREKAVQVSALMVLFSGVAFLLLVALLRAPLAKAMDWPVDRVSLLAFALFGQIVSVFFEEAAIAMGLIWKGALFNTGFELVRTSTVVIVALVTRNLMTIFVVHSLITALKAVVGYLQCHRHGFVRLSWDKPVAKEVWRYALPVSLAWMFGILIGYVDQLILSTYIPADEFAFYSIGCLSIPPLILLEHSVARVLIPQLSSAFSKGESARAAALFKKSVEDLAFILIPAVAGLIVFAKPIIVLLFTDRFLPSARYLPFFAISYLTLMIPYDSVPRARGQADWIFKNFMSFSLVAIVLCLALTFPFGAMGALAGSLIAKSSMRVYSILYLHRNTQWELKEFLPVQAITRFTVVCAALAALCLVSRPWFPSERIWFLASGAAFAISYFLLTLRWKHLLDRKEAHSYKVLMLTQHLGIGGLERMILKLCESLAAAGKWSPSVFVFDHDHSDPPEVHLLQSFASQEIPVETFEKPKGFSPRTVMRIARNILRNDIMVLHTHDLGALIYGVGAKWLTLGKVKLVHTQHSFVHLQRQKRYRLYEKFFTSFVDELAVVSEDTKKTYVELGVSENHVHVVGNGVSFPDAPILDRKQKLAKRPSALDKVSQVDIDIQDIWILYMARLHPGKGQDHAIRLWESLEPAFRKKMRLLVVGPETDQGRLSFLRDLAAKAADQDRILFLGPTQDPGLWLQISDIYLSCSEFEGMPLGPIEAAGAGLPLVLSQIKGHEILAQISSQYPLDQPQAGAGQVSAMASRIETAGSSYYQDLWQRSGWVRGQFSIQAMASRYEGLYR